MKEKIPDKNIFMMCNKVNGKAFSKLPLNFHARNCRENELDIWKTMPFDSKNLARKYYNYMTDFFNKVYLAKKDQFYKKCMFVCDSKDKPIATCFIWKSYDKINTIHWLKVLKEYEGLGIGRALLTIIMQDLKKDDYPVYLHTQPASYRAIKLYSDFGFKLMSNEKIGSRTNDLKECLPILKRYMPTKDYKKIKIIKAPECFNTIVSSSNINEF